MKIINVTVERRFVTGKYEHINIIVEGKPETEVIIFDAIKILDDEIINYFNSLK